MFITKIPRDQLSHSSPRAGTTVLSAPHLREFTTQLLHFAGGLRKRTELFSKAHELLVQLLLLLTDWPGDVGQETPFFYLKTEIFFLPYLKKIKNALRSSERTCCRK